MTKLIRYERQNTSSAALSDVHAVLDNPPHRKRPGIADEYQTVCGRWYESGTQMTIDPDSRSAREEMCKRCAAKR